MVTWTRKSSQPLALYLPVNTTFFYHWSDQSAIENMNISKLSVIKTKTPNDKLAELKNLLQSGFVNTQEIIWFRIEGSDDDNFMLRLDKAEQTAKWLVANRQDYNYLLVDNGVLLVSKDAWLPNNYKDQPKIDLASNTLGVGVNIFWSKNEAPDFLADLTKWLKLEAGLPNIYANIYQQKDGQINIHVWQTKLRQLINASSTVEWPNQANFPLNADLVFGFGDHGADEWQAVVSQNILQPIFTDLPYYRLSAKKIEEQVLKNNFIYLSNNKWLMVSSEDWQSRINDWVPDLKLKEVKNRLPDGTLYTELVGEQGAEVENLSYQKYSYWHLGQFYGAQIGPYYYLSNNESTMQATLVSKYNVQSYLNNCQVQGDYKIIDLAQINSANIKDELIKKTLLNQNINNLTVFSYENNLQIGFKACLK